MRSTVKLVLCSLLLLVAAAPNLMAWPGNNFPQCPNVACSSGCVVPASPKCEEVAQSWIDDGIAVACVDPVTGLDGVCYP